VIRSTRWSPGGHLLQPHRQTFAKDHTRIVAACSDLDQALHGQQDRRRRHPAALDGKGQDAYTGMVVTDGLPLQFTVRGDRTDGDQLRSRQAAAIDINKLP